MTPALHDQILERLLADPSLDETVVNLVDAACQGDVALSAALTSLGGPIGTHASPPVRSRRPPPSGVYLTSIELAGFRGIGRPQRLELKPGPGLTVVLGRNGSGKSSFAEGLETLLTGSSRRWAARPKEWRQGWRNLHAGSGAYVEAAFCVEGSEPIVVRRSWKEGAELEDGELRVRRGKERLDGLGALGWEQPLSTFRPFLSYSELGALLGEPSKLYDELHRILGLGEITDASKRLATARQERRARKDAMKRDLGPILRDLAQSDDPRAATCTEALSGRKLDLDAVENAVHGESDDTDESAIVQLRRLAQLQPPSLDQVAEAAKALRRALAAQAELAGSSAETNAALAGLLESAVSYVEAEGGPCPLCLRPLDAKWQEEARDRLTQAKSAAATMREATAELRRCMVALRSLITPMPAALDQVEAHGLPTTARDAWRAWADAPDDPGALCDHAETRALELAETLTELNAAARTQLESLESTWRPLARRLGTWLDAARAVERERVALKALEAAEKWLRNASASLRDERFQPISQRAQAIWSLLRQSSSVDLAGVRLEGSKTRRRVALDVTVDGKEGVALGVMSQGELNALALSLFLPRVSLPDSPLHFVVVDDPVQAMDPHKVDGLARALEEVARTRQLLVLTHDARLFEAIRRLGIRATVVEVTRRAQSVVELSVAQSPVDRHLGDARQCLRHEQKIGPKIAQRTIPGFCRLALEAACVEAIRRRRLGRGDPHAEVERAIEDATGLHAIAALALFDDATRTDTVFTHLNTKYGPWAANTFRAAKEGAHGRNVGSLQDLVAATKELASSFRSLR